MTKKRFPQPFIKSLFLTSSLLLAPFSGLTAPIPVKAASNVYYVNPSAAGSNSGLDWKNAFKDLPTGLERGATYYLADGNYASHKFADAGTDWIYIKKATLSDHGTNTGWSNSMGDGVAVMAPMSFTTGNYEINGQIGGGPNNFTSGHGIKITSDSDKAKAVNIQSPVSNLVFNHVEMTLGFKSGYTGQDIIYGVKGGSNWTIKNSYLHHSSRTILYTINVSGILIENSQLERNGQNQAQHSEIWSARETHNVVIKNNILKDYVSTGGIIMGGAKNWNIYGNIFTWSKNFGTTANNGAIGSWSSSDKYYATDINIYNNTFINLNNGGSGKIFPIYNQISNIAAYNNIWQNSPATSFGGGVKHDYNLFKNSNEAKIAETNKQISATDIVNSNTFKILAATKPGMKLNSPYDYDMAGNKRGADGVWDRGAFEFGEQEMQKNTNTNQPAGESSYNEIGDNSSESQIASGNSGSQTEQSTSTSSDSQIKSASTTDNNLAENEVLNSSGNTEAETSSGNTSTSENISPGGSGSNYVAPTPSQQSGANPESKKNLPFPSGSLLKSSDNPAVYLIENEQKRPIASEEAFLSYGYKWPEIKTVSSSTLNQYPAGQTLHPNSAVKAAAAPNIPEEFKSTALVKTPNSPTVYTIVNGKKHAILNEELFKAYGFDWKNIKTIPEKNLNIYPRTSLIKTENSPTVYYITAKGQKKAIPNEAIFLAYGNKWSDVIKVVPQELNKYPDVNLIKAENNAKIYLLENDTKKYITSTAALAKSGFSFADVVTVKQAEIDWYQTGEDVE